jgi:hypothetical protein
VRPHLLLYHSILTYSYDTRSFTAPSDTVSTIDDSATTYPKPTTVRLYQL